MTMQQRHPPTQQQKQAALNVTFLLLLAVLAGSIFYAATPLLALNKVSSRTDYAINGYDTVAYFTKQRPIRGNKTYMHDWNGATWLFSSKKHLQLFQDHPQRYAPQYGGYCAWGIGKKSSLYSSDPTAWSIRDDKLYLNYNAAVRESWLKSPSKFIKKGDLVWKELLEKDDNATN